MPTKTAPKSKKTIPSITETHDYLRLNLGNGRRFTITRNGYTAAGMPADVFNAMISFCRRVCDSPDGNPGKAIKSLAEPAKLAKLWPEWNALPALRAR